MVRSLSYGVSASLNLYGVPRQSYGVAAISVSRSLPLNQTEFPFPLVSWVSWVPAIAAGWQPSLAERSRTAKRGQLRLVGQRIHSWRTQSSRGEHTQHGAARNQRYNNFAECASPKLHAKRPARAQSLSPPSSFYFIFRVTRFYVRQRNQKKQKKDAKMGLKDREKWQPGKNKKETFRFWQALSVRVCRYQCGKRAWFCEKVPTWEGGIKQCPVIASSFIDGHPRRSRKRVTVRDSHSVSLPPSFPLLSFTLIFGFTSFIFSSQFFSVFFCFFVLLLLLLQLAREKSDRERKSLSLSFAASPTFGGSRPHPPNRSTTRAFSGLAPAKPPDARRIQFWSADWFFFFQNATLVCLRRIYV